MRSIVLSALALVTFLKTAQGDVLYRFDVNGADNIRAFSFSLASSTFIEAGTPLSFAPFTVTDAVTSWRMVQGRAPGACFEFGTSGASLVNCGFVLPGASSEGGFNLDILGGALPSTTGLYDFDGEGSFLSNGDLTFVILTGSLAVSETSSTPEPSSIALWSIGIAGLAIIFCRRQRIGRSSAR